MTNQDKQAVYNKTLDFVNSLENSDSKKVINSNLKFYLKFLAVAVLISTSYYLSYFFVESYLSYVATFFLAISIAHMGMTVFHELGHRAVMKTSHSLGDFLYYATCAVSGYSGALWRHKHNALHHVYTNVSNDSDEYSDPDVSEQPINMTSDPSFNKFYQNYQHFYAWFLYPFLAISMQVQSLKHFVTKMNKEERFTYMLCQASHFSMFVVFPLALGHTIGVVAIKYAIVSATASFTLAMIFQMAHIVDNVPVITMTNEETKEMFSSISEVDMFFHQLATTSNFSVDNPLVTYFTGGLTHQVEHHLFPSVSFHHYPKISRFLRKTLDNHGAISEYKHNTFTGSVKAHYRALKSGTCEA